MVDTYNILDRRTTLAQYERVTATASQVEKTWDNRVLVLWMFLNLSTSGTAGSRRVAADIRTASVGIFTARASADQEASLAYGYFFQQGIYEAVPLDLNHQIIPLPANMIMEKDWILRVRDQNSVSGSDSFTLDIRYQNLSA